MKRILLMAGAALVLLELGLRFGVGLGDPPLVIAENTDIEYRMKPDAEYWRFGNRVAINEQGLRGVAFRDTPEPRELRILLIGDSVVYGNHFLDQSETIAVQLTQKLQTHAPEACQITVAPVAVSSWGPVNQWSFLERFGFYGAQTAVLVLSSHDLVDVPVARREYIPYRTQAPLGAIGDALVIAYERLSRASLAPPAEIAPRAARKARSLDALVAMFKGLEKAGIETHLYLHPVNGPDPASEEAFPLFEEHAQRHDVLVHDMRADVSAAGGAALYRDLIHPNATGAAFYADQLAALLSAKVEAC